ncbi:unnamed protein product [Adineta steineri]|uniref:Protein kinase domain-containing protein n=1 Tax=Adineta steineri TaxID=433720 RepID=A0A815L072_9BILA|nr:unnamed protein product [Adineta steineri]CAF1396728.1 unnamed protein product [Adineta steineri]CAF1409550.1 unnamed protein product [Adineta steineri]CAF3580731.1 unnamed protein product [Adineta steineri]CAF3711980.1 unnamed protein product [Adineta steineri]
MGNNESGMFDRPQDGVKKFGQDNKKQDEATVEQMSIVLGLHKHGKEPATNLRGDRKQIEIDGITYELTQFVNRGGFGQVYKAQDRKRNRAVALKVMSNKIGMQDEIKSEIHFLRLIKNIDIDNHPVIEYYACKFTRENIFIAMELASCDLLSFWFHNTIRTDSQQKFIFGLIIIIYVLRALIFLEKLNIIHGDIKPQNLVIVQNSQRFYLKLIDFGTVEKMNTKCAQITVDASKAYTVYFASPEFLHRDSNHIISRHLHKKSDAWAAGVMFYVLFFGKVPWKDEHDYENFCNDSHARDIIVPREGGYKSIIELLLKKNPDERSSAKATYLQMKGHPTLGPIIKSFQQHFCSVDDVCYMRIPDNVRDELAKLPRSRHSVSGSSSSVGKSTLGSRRPCRYGRDCYRKDFEHRKEFSHPGDSDYPVSTDHTEKPKCRYGADCYRTDYEHRKKYSHPADSDHDHTGKPKCRYGKACYDKSLEHLRRFSHPNDSAKEKCRYGSACYKTNDPEHMARFSHD